MRLAADNWSAPVCAGGTAQPRGFTLIELAVAIVIISILAAIALPNYIKIKEKAREAEVKASLHNIQLELERFAVDREGVYPDYLVGGNNTAFIGLTNDESGLGGQIVELPSCSSSDTMIREGYLSSYPRNPFVRDGRAVFRMQRDIGDALRSMSPTGELFGTRFGARGDIMGQALCDPRWMVRPYTAKTGKQLQVQTYSSIQYEFYDVWMGTRVKPFLPGSFLYKSIGDIVPSVGRREHLVDVDMISGGKTAVQSDTWDRVTIPVNLNRYVLSAWGGLRSKGQDLLGEEPLVVFDYHGTRRITGSGGAIFSPEANASICTPYTHDYYEMLGVPPWTRGVNRSHIGPLWGSPYSAGTNGQQLNLGNPNGLNDALILVLTGGGDRSSEER